MSYLTLVILGRLKVHRDNRKCLFW